jgi:hypothetical protein
MFTMPPRPGMPQPGEAPGVPSVRPPVTSNPQQVPVSPMQPPIQGPVAQPTGGQEMATEEQKQEILALIEKVKQKFSTVDAVQFAASKDSEIFRKQMLSDVFAQLKAAGVDLSSQESVTAFIENLQKTNPELALQFENSMDVLLGSADPSVLQQNQGPTQDPNAIPPQNNMNNVNPNEALPQNP